MRYRTLQNDSIKSFIAKNYESGITVTEDSDKHVLVSINGIDNALRVVKKRTNYYVQHGQFSLLVRDYRELKAIIDSVLMSVAGYAQNVSNNVVTISGSNLVISQG